MTTIQDRIIKDFRKKVNELRGLLPRTDEDSEVVNFGYKTSRGNELFTVVDWGNIEQFLIKSIKEVEEETRKETLDLIAEDQGWEESRDIYANALGLPLKYPKLMESYKKRNHIKGKIILDCQNLSITNKDNKK